jgi:phosphate transport system substrate-binding protein
MRNHKISLILLIGVWFALLPTRAATRFHIEGSETMQALGQRLTAWYTRKNPAIQFDIALTAVAASFAALAEGKVEIVQSSRRMLHSEEGALRSAQGKTYVELQVATEIAGIVVNQGNPVEDLSLFQLRQLLSGTVKNWKQFGGLDAPIRIYGRDSTCGVRGFIEEEFMGDEGISSSAKTFPTNSTMLAAVGHDVDAVGFGSVERSPDAHVRFLAIKPSASAEAIAPTGDSIRANRYKLVRPLYFYFAGPPKGELLRFAEWVLSPEGQLVVESVGYYPLGPAEREAGHRLLTEPNPKIAYQQ